MQTIDQAQLNKLLDKAKIGLMQHPETHFFTTILFSMKFVWDDAHPTAWTTGLKLGFNRNFFLSLRPEERIGVLVHECCHVAYMHTVRLGTRDRNLFNIAADHVINLYLLERGFKLPAMRLADDRFKGMSTEEVYKLLQEEQQQGAPQPQNGMPDLREPGEGDGEGQGDKMPADDLKRSLDDILVRAITHSRMANEKPGAIPGEIELYLDKLLDPKLPWQTILRKWLKSLGKFDYSWKRPNRRFMPDHYLPSLWSEGAMVDFQAWVDISGSETDEDFQRFVSEINGILRMMKPKKIELGQFDTCIKSITPVRNVVDLANVKFHGRGGTVITDVLDHIEKTKPKVAMIFTDGGFYHDRDTCNTNILWMIHDNPDWTAPFGKIIYYNTHTE
jgi:predicted metal-dependent peptidase